MDAVTRFPIFLRMDPGTWTRVQVETLQRRVLTVIAAFALAAWNRFGAQGFLGPRAPIRMLLIGIWGWLVLSFIVWLIARRFDEDLRNDPLYGFQRAAVSMSVTYFPVIIVGFYMATFGAFIRTPIPGLILLAVAVFAWIPALYARAMQHLTNLDRGPAVLAIAVPYLLWLATVGRYWWQQVGHLI